MYKKPSPLPVANHLPSGLNTSAYIDRRWSLKTCKHSPVTVSQNLAVPSKEDLKVIIIKSKMWARRIMRVLKLYYVAIISFVPGGWFGHHATVVTEWRCPFSTTGWSTTLFKPGITSAFTRSRFHIRAVPSSEQEANLVALPLHLIRLTSSLWPLGEKDKWSTNFREQ